MIADPAYPQIVGNYSSTAHIFQLHNFFNLRTVGDIFDN